MDSQLWLLPRGHFKSTIVSKGFPLWLLVRDPNLRIGIFNWSENLVQGFLREAKTHIEKNRVFNRYWPSFKPDKPEVWNNEAIQVSRTLIDSTPSIQALSLQANTVGSHHDLHIYDDIVNAESVQTIDAIRKTHDRFIDLGAILNPPDGNPFVGCRRMIGTRWHWGDEYNRIMTDHPEDWFIQVRKAIENGHPILPRKFTKKILEKKRREMGSWHFSAQYMNNPVDEENAPFPPKIVRRYHKCPLHYVQHTPCNVFIAIDPAWSTDGSDCYWGIVVGAMNHDNTVVIVETRLLRQKPKFVCLQIASLCKKWRPARIAFEAVGGQQYLMKELRETLDEADIRVGIIGVSHRNQRKETRVLSLQPHFENKKIYIHLECEDLYQQLIRFPRDPQRDLVDALEMLMRVAQPPSIGVSYDGQVAPGTGMHELKRMVDKNRRRAGRNSGLAKQRWKRPQNA